MKNYFTPASGHQWNCIGKDGAQPRARTDSSKNIDMALRKLLFRVYALNSTPHSVKVLNTHMSAFSVLSPNSDLRVKHDRHNLCFSINLDGEGERGTEQGLPFTTRGL